MAILVGPWLVSAMATLMAGGSGSTRAGRVVRTARGVLPFPLFFWGMSLYRALRGCRPVVVGFLRTDDGHNHRQGATSCTEPGHISQRAVMPTPVGDAHRSWLLTPLSRSRSLCTVLPCVTAAHVRYCADAGGWDSANGATGSTLQRDALRRAPPGHQCHQGRACAIVRGAAVGGVMSRPEVADAAYAIAAPIESTLFAQALSGGFAGFSPPFFLWRLVRSSQGPAILGQKYTKRPFPTGVHCIFESANSLFLWGSVFWLPVPVSYGMSRSRIAISASSLSRLVLAPTLGEHPSGRVITLLYTVVFRYCVGPNRLLAGHNSQRCR